VNFSGIKKKSVGLLLLVACVCPLVNATPKSHEQLGVGELIELAMASHPTVAGRLAGVEAAEQDVRAARLHFYPTPAVSTTRLGDEAATVLGLTQPLWTGGRLSGALKSSQLKHQISQIGVDDARQALALRTIGLTQLYMAQFQKKASQKLSIERLASLVGLIERRVQQGISAEGDYTIARSRMVQARSELTAIEAQLQVALSQLSRLTGRLVQEKDIKMESVDTDWAMARSLNDWQDKAEKNDPSLRSIRTQSEMVGVDADIAAAALWPTLSLRAEHQTGRHVGSSEPGDRVYFLLNYSLGAGVSSIADRDAARARARAAHQGVDAAQREVQDKVQQAWSDMQTAAARLPDLVISTKASEDVFESSGRLFVTGRRSWFELLNSVRELANNEQQEADVRAQALGAYFRLLILTGSSLSITKE
jgi:adhesin transport system outer membrane protein